MELEHRDIDVDGHVEEYDENQCTCIPSLLRLALDCITKRLWLSEIHGDWFENRVMNCERVKNKLRQNLEFTFSLPPPIEKMLVKNIDIVGNKIRDEFADWSGPRLLTLVFKNRCWRDFAPSIWDYVKENGVSYSNADIIFHTIMVEIDYGTLSVPSDEISFYLSMWKTFPKDLKYQVMVSLSSHGRDNYCNGFAHNLLFFTNLLMEFDAEEKREIWAECYLELIVGTNLSHLERLMKLCLDDDEEVAEFKRQIFVQCGHADQYCYRLIDDWCLVDLENFLVFSSTNELEKEQLTKRVLHQYFAGNPIPESYDTLLEMVQSKGYIRQVIMTDEFQHLFRVPIEFMKRFCHLLIDQGNFQRLKEFVNFFIPPEKNIPSFWQEVIASFFYDNVLYLPEFTGQWLLSESNLEEFNDLIEEMFVTFEAAAAFKKNIMFSTSVFNIVGAITFPLSEASDSCFNRMHDAVSYVEKLSSLFLSSEQDLSEWKDIFMAHSIKSMRHRYWRIFSPVINNWEEVYAWFLDSEENKVRFKASLSMDEILSNYIHVENSDLFSWHFDLILRWYYSNNEEQIVFFKLKTLGECDFGDYARVRDVLLGPVHGVFDLCTNDFDRLDVLRQGLTLTRHH